MRVAPEFPATTFITTGGSSVATNVAALSFSFDEPSYLAGMAAAAVSKNGVIGAIGGTELPPVRTSFAAYEAGARAMNPTIRILTSYIGNWEDAAAAKEQALAQVARGADVIFQNADAAGLGVFQAMREAPGRWIIGANADQNGIAPGITLGSVVIDIPHAFLLVATEVRDGRFESRVVRLGSSADVVRWTPNPALDVIPPPAQARIDSVRSRLIRGEAVLPTEPRP
jgi:basic membrane lipoprotein Med (substrate-binding protein (PBP1-ABC) superfamily)